MNSLETNAKPLTSDTNVQGSKMITPKSTASESKIDSANFSDGTETITHGYVHGHIHKHKDHTHIHGHIHNHDHQQKANALESKDSDLCRKLEDYSSCKEVLCDELDDCFFLNCEDTKANEPIKCNDYCNDEIAEAADVIDTTSYNQSLGLENSEVFNTNINQEKTNNHSHSHHHDIHNSYPLEHDNNLCIDQLNKKPIFENLISSVHKNFNDQEEDTKKRKLNSGESLDIHYPHHCHTDNNVDALINGNISNLNNIHQSCFHTTIPNLQTTNNAQMISDFDFFIQFENFNKFIQNNGIPEPINTFNETNNNKFDLTSINNSGDSTADLNLSYSCKWNNCFKRVTDSNLMDHIVSQHIQEEYGKNDQVESFYQCEWNECNYSNTDYKSLVAHLNSHKNDQIFDSILSNQAILSPASTSKSDASSPLIEGNKPNDSVSIKSIKISPKYNSCCDDQSDPYFTCHWQVGVDSFGKPIQCSKIHDSAGDLQHHLINDHIGSGKSSYSCNWIGCNRHNGHIFTQRQKLLRHIHIHTKYKPCKCDICGASFAVDSMLKQHLRTHSGEKPFSCSICDKKFATSSSLSIHNRVHTGEKPLVCKWPGCNKRFSESSNLTKHMKIHMKTFKCDICGIEFDKKPNYTKHMKLHDTINKTTKRATSISTT